MKGLKEMKGSPKGNKPTVTPRNPTIMQRGQQTLTVSGGSYESSDARKLPANEPGSRSLSTNTHQNNRADNRRSSTSNTVAKSRENETYGIIVALKPTFAFLQPLVGEDQVFVPEREFYENMKMGDKVAYISKTGQKGLQAEHVRFLVPHLEKLVTVIKGTVLRSPDRHRSGMGLVEVDLTSAKPEVVALLEKHRKEIAYRPADVVESTIPKHHRLDKGDSIEFSISKVHDSMLLFACNVKLLQLKRDRVVAVQMQRMLDAGAVRELGVISMLKKGDYGFIKAQDRKDEIYFRLDDIVEDEESGEKVGEGSEVEYFVICEIIKGKPSDRAIHIKKAPKGSVQFEVSLALSVRAVVVEENTCHPHEVPGRLRLLKPVSVEALTGKKNDTISSIELWQRCLPDELQCKVGDELVLDVQYYRPEKLYFARSVKVASFRKIGREYGVIVSKKEHGFGFIYSQLRNMDIYFRSTHVVGRDGEVVEEATITTSSYVSFEALMEEGNSGYRLKAFRVRLEDAEEAKVCIAEVSKNVIQRDVVGVVLKNSLQKDTPGLLRMHPTFFAELSESIDYSNRSLVEALTEFRDCSELKRVSMHGLPVSLLRAYYHTIDKSFPGIAYDTALISEKDPSAGKTLVLSKPSAEEYAVWRASDSVTNLSPVKLANTSKQHAPDCVQFFKEDYITPEFGPLANDLKVVFDLCFDTSKGRRVAKSIRLTDEPVLDAPERNLGVMEVVVEKEKNEPFGFIRCIPSDERLYWHCSETYLPYGQDLRTGTDVSFALRRRGGLRVAVDIEVLEAGANSKQETLPEPCSGVVVEGGEVVLLDVSNSASLNAKYVDLRLLHQVVTSNHREVVESGSWEKLKLADESPSATPDAELEAEVSPSSRSQPSPMPMSLDSNGSSGVPTGDVLEMEYKAKYFASLPRLPLPVQTSAADSYVPAVGDIVTCVPVVNWALQRAPLALSVQMATDPAAVAVKRKGRINRLKFRVKSPVSSDFVSADTLATYSLQTIDFVEILLESESRTKEQRQEELNSYVGATAVAAAVQAKGGYNGLYYYCDVREIRLSSDNCRDVVAHGDDVDFWTVSSAGNIALGVVLCPKLTPKEIQFGLKRGPVNAELKDVKVKAGTVNVVTMAQGPPNDAAKGFEPGWREAFGSAKVDVSALPWAALLSP